MRTNRRTDDDRTRADTAELVAAIGSGDHDAEARLVRKYRPGVLYILRRELRAHDVADDLAQETFRITLERLRGRSLDHPEKLSGFIVGIVRRLLMAHRRRADRSRANARDVPSDLLDPAPAPCDALIRAEEAGAVRRAIRALKMRRDRELLTRRYLLEEDRVSICHALGLTLRQLDKALYRARTRLKRVLGAGTTHP